MDLCIVRAGVSLWSLSPVVPSWVTSCFEHLPESRPVYFCKGYNESDIYFPPVDSLSELLGVILKLCIALTF